MCPHARREFGNKGEELAEQFLKRAGMQVLERQYKTQTGEIDLICKDAGEIVFVEVKARRSRAFGYPEESVSKNKIEKILAVGQQYLAETGQEVAPYRIDVVAIEFIGTEKPEVTHFSHIGY